MANILTIGQSALIAAQAGMSTAGQNIANAATPGYSRQTVVQNAVTAQPMTFGYLGQGTKIDEIKRIYNDFLGIQKVSAQSASSELQVQTDQIQPLNNMLADPAAGLSPVMQSFFNSLQDVSLNPGDVTPREALLSSAEALSSGFHDLQGRLTDMRQSLNLQIGISVQSVNAAATQLSTLNQAIAKANGDSNGKPSNDLLDQRDQLIADLSKEVKVTVVKQDDQYSVFIGNGQPLVVGVSVHTLKALPSTTDPTRLEVAYDTSGQNSIMTSDNLAGGALGGLLEFRAKTLEPAQNSLNLIALGLASGMNDSNKAGYTAANVKGGDFFTMQAISAMPSTSNTGNGSIDITITDVSKLTISDYRLQNIGGNYSLTRSSDNAVLSSTSFAAAKTAAQTQGFSLVDSGMINPGDEFVIRPTANVASSLTVAITKITDIAAASNSSSVPGDGGNILEMLKLQTKKTLNGGKNSYQDAYAQLVSQVGSKTRELNVTSKSANSILSQADRAVQDVSGVNLDEEAASLLRYQQAYQAAGKVIALSQQMFDSLMQAVG